MDVTFSRQTVISFPDNDELPDITTGIADSSLVIDEVLYTDRFTVGTYNANRFEVELYNFPTIGSEKIYVYQIIDEVDGEEPIEQPLFTGYVDSCVTNRGRLEDSKKIVAYDILHSKSNVDVSAWWEQVFDTATQVSVKTLRESLLTYVGISFDSVTLPNDSILIKQNQQLNNISFESAFKYILEVNATNANVSRDGTVKFVTVSDNTISIDDTYAQNTSEFETYIVPAYEGVRITNSTKNVVGVVGESNYFEILDNLLLLDKSDTGLKVIAQNILNAISGISYRSATIDMIWHQPNITVGDIVSIDNKQYLVCENYINGSQLVDQQIVSSGSETIDDAPSEYDASKKDMQVQIQASSMKYYRYQNLRALEFTYERPIISIRYTSARDGIIIFHGCVIFDVDRINDNQSATVKIQYSINNTVVREYTPTQTYYHDGRYTINLLHFWESSAGHMDRFVVYLTPTNCKITIGAFRCEGYMEGMGLVGDAIWDGIIDVEDDFTPFTFRTTPSSLDAIAEDVDVSIITPHEIDVDDDIVPFTFRTTPSSVTPIIDILYINKDMLRKLTWDEVKESTWQEIYNKYVW